MHGNRHTRKAIDPQEASPFGSQSYYVAKRISALLEAAAELREAEKAVAQWNVTLGQECGFLTPTYSPNALVSLTFHDLRAAYDALMTTTDIMYGLIAQPKFQGRNPNSYNAAGELMSQIVEIVGFCATAVLEEAERRKPATQEDAETRGWHILHNLIESRENLGEALETGRSIAAQMERLRQMASEGQSDA